MTKEVQITFDCADPARLAAFWAEALGYRVQPPPDGYDSWDAALEAFGVPRDQWNSRSAILPVEGPYPRVFFQRVPEGKTVKNRVHLDVRAAPGLTGEERMCALEAEANRLEALGATRAHRVDPDAAAMELGFVAMRDPEGNEFCLDKPDPSLRVSCIGGCRQRVVDGSVTDVAPRARVIPVVDGSVTDAVPQPE